MQPKTLQEAVIYFSDANNCVDYMANKRWPNGVVTCPTCGRKDVTFLHTQRKWQCKSAHPKRQFSAKVGTIFEDSPIPLEKWLVVVWMICNCKNGVSSYEVARTIQVTQKTAWFMLHRIRFGMQDVNSGKLPSSGGPIEIDETFIGGKARNMHASKKARIRKQAGGLRGGNAKTIVMGLLQRDGKIKTAVIPQRKAPIVHEVIRDCVELGANIITDEATCYDHLTEQYAHEIINHMEGYVRGHVTTNSIENFWSLLKRGLGGTYVSVEPFHLFRYLDEQMFRFNNRATKHQYISDSDRFNAAMSQIFNKRLTYAEVTGKVGTTPDQSIPF